MSTEDKNTRYFIEIDLGTLEIIRVGYENKHNLDKGRQTDPGVHRLFLPPGQYRKFVERCEADLQAVLDT